MGDYGNTEAGGSTTFPAPGSTTSRSPAYPAPDVDEAVETVMVQWGCSDSFTPMAGEASLSLVPGVNGTGSVIANGAGIGGWTQLAAPSWVTFEDEAVSLDAGLYVVDQAHYLTLGAAGDLGSFSTLGVVNPVTTASGSARLGSSTSTPASRCSRGAGPPS